ncbi:VOC family protein [Alkalicoccobacillus porphyridii]|uniref:VOC family protein n=1 Tax=Alkalicoccobacillus porphyridii TaxID=2597270 RepID=A0A554A268_9BACI|nr:VOC family protein [Alkalicoccobacillus porphyridii]TSB47794.1 VOC family protein [Alkalicoccobacillus porphyridii]
MAISLNHVVCFTKDNEASAKQFADVMGLTIDGYEGFDNKFVKVGVNEESAIFFQKVEENYPLQHLAFEVDGDTFNLVMDRMLEQKLSFGNSPTNTTNQQTDHPFAERGLFWFQDGCLFELMTDAKE